MLHWMQLLAWEPSWARPVFGVWEESCIYSEGETPGCTAIWNNNRNVNHNLPVGSSVTVFHVISVHYLI